MTTFKFFKYVNGISSFAAISLELAEGHPEAIFWADEITALESIYGGFVRLGIKDALRWHVASGGQSTAFHVLDFIELLVDTKPDAARCAVTAAAWKALGHNEAEIDFKHDGQWSANLLT